MKKTAQKFNKVVLLLTMSDIFSWGPLVIISSLSGIYLAERFGANVASVVGIGTGAYYLTRALFQVPIGALTDKIKKDTDEILILILGVLLMGLPYIFYPLLTAPIQYYFLQFVFGLGVSLNVVNWRKLFALNISEGMEGKQYAIYDTALSVCTAILSAIIGIIANLGDKYFSIVMIASGVTMMLASIWVVLILTVKTRNSRKSR